MIDDDLCKPFGTSPVKPHDPELWDEVRKEIKKENEAFLEKLGMAPFRGFPKWVQDYAKNLKRITDEFLNT